MDTTVSEVWFRIGAHQTGAGPSNRSVYEVPGPTNMGETPMFEIQAMLQYEKILRYTSLQNKTDQQRNSI